MKKKLLIALLSVSVLIGITACKKQEVGNNSTFNATESTSNNSEYPEEDTLAESSEKDFGRY